MTTEHTTENMTENLSDERGAESATPSPTQWLFSVGIFVVGLYVLFASLSAGTPAGRSTPRPPVATAVKGSWESSPRPRSQRWAEDGRAVDRGSRRVVVSPSSEPHSSKNKKNTRSTTNTEPRATLSYVVVEGDSLWRIAERELGAGVHWKRLLEANSGLRADALREGMVLEIPLGPNEKRTPKPANSVHVVAAGETLTSIAQNYRPGQDWKWLYNDNRDVIADPDMMSVGVALKIRRR